MSRGQGVLWAAFLCLTSFLFPGCQQSPSVDTNADLKRINMAYLMFGMQMRKAPSNVDELTPFLVSTNFPESHRKLEEESLRQLKEGKYVVIWNQQDALDSKDGTDIVTAYEQGAAEKGGYVVFADGRVQRLGAEEVQRATRRENQ